MTEEQTPYYTGSIEKHLEKKLTLLVRNKGGLSLKFIPTFFTGAPDRLILMPEGKAYWAEIKDTGKKPSKIQAKVHSVLRGLGFTVYVIDSEESLRECIDEI